MITFERVQAKISHVILDHIQSAMDPIDYYKINHIPADQIEELARMVAGWLNKNGIDIEFQEAKK